MSGFSPAVTKKNTGVRTLTLSTTVNLILQTFTGSSVLEIRFEPKRSQNLELFVIFLWNNKTPRRISFYHPVVWKLSTLYPSRKVLFAWHPKGFFDLFLELEAGKKPNLLPFFISFFPPGALHILSHEPNTNFQRPKMKLYLAKPKFCMFEKFSPNKRKKGLFCPLRGTHTHTSTRVGFFCFSKRKKNFFRACSFLKTI